MNKNYLKKFLIIFGVILIIPFKNLYTEERPNIVIIICDDLNDTIEGMGGHPQAITPNIDRLIKSGVRFTNAASNSPICGPSRASLWSGLHPVNTGMFGGNQQVNRWHNNEAIKNKKTLFEALIDQGYYNFSTGKIFHNGHEREEIYQNLDGSSGYGSKPNFGPYPNDGGTDQNTVRKGVLPPWWPESHRNMGSPPYDGFGPVQDIKKYGDNWKWKSAHYSEEWEYRDGHNRDLLPDEVHAKEAVDFLEKDYDMPFLLTVGFSRPHSPWYAPQEFFDIFPIDSVKLTQILENDLEDCSKILYDDKDLAQPWGYHKYQKYLNMSNGGIQKLKEWTQAYLACVAYVDAQVGKVLDAIKKRDDAQNTLIIFTSDHGYHMGEKNYIFKLTPWEESVRIPFVVSGPNVSKNMECVSPISLIDLYPTCLDYAQASATHKLDGFSLKELLENPGEGKWDGPSYSLSAIGGRLKVELNKPAPIDEQHLSLRTKEYRYIRCRNGEEELYDHQSDPNEWVNLVGNQNYIKVLKILRSEMNSALENLVQ